MDESDPTVQAFHAALKSAPESIRRRVSERTSTGDFKTGRWTLRDAAGVELWKTPEAPPPAERKPNHAQARNDPLVRALEKRADQARELGLCNARASVQIAEALRSVRAELDQLKTQASAIQRRMDFERRGIVFRGAWQQAADYELGSVVAHKDRAYVATKAIRQGGEPPSRHGTGWIHMFDSAEVLR